MKKLLSLFRRRRAGDMVRVFELSRINGGAYYGDSLSDYRWQWPKRTWMSERKRRIEV